MTKNLAYAAVLGVAMTVGPTAASAQSLPTDGLVNVNLQNILNNLAVDLNVDRANIPVTAQIPVSVAANVCGVSLNVLSAQIGTGGATCTAVTGSQELTQAVQQQMAAGAAPRSARRPARRSAARPPAARPAAPDRRPGPRR